MTDATPEACKILNTNLKLFRHGMLVTKKENTLRARPMHIARVGDTSAIWLFSTVDSPKVDELDHDNSVCLTLQSGDMFISLTGTARIVRDSAIIDAYWTDDLKVWFPEGKYSADLCLVKIEPDYGELWDWSGILKKLESFVQDSVAYLKGEQIPPRLEESSLKVRLSVPPVGL